MIILRPTPTSQLTTHVGMHGKHARTQQKRALIIVIAMRYFAERGYEEARVQDMAAELKIAKGSIFQYFQSKEGLFFACYKQAISSFPAYLDAPAEVQEKGFFETLRYWLEHTQRLLREDWIPYRIALLGNYGTDLGLKREINRFLVTEDPYGTHAFVQRGIELGEVRSDVETEMIVSILDWTMERFQDALLTEELDPGLFRGHGLSVEKTQIRIEQFLKILRAAIGTHK